MNNQEKMKLLKRTIYLCWGALILCFIVKLLGGNYFEIIATNEKFISLCDWLEYHGLNDVIKAVFYCFNLGILISIFSRSEFKSFTLKFFIISICIISWVIKRQFALIGAVIETALMLILPMFISKEKKSKTFVASIIGYLLVNVLQLVSLFVKNIDSMIVKENFIIGLIFQIDYYIMIILYYLYYVKMKGAIKMDWGVLWLGDSKAMDKGYARFINVMSILGIILTFPISVPYLLWKKHKNNKMIKVKN